MHQQSKAMAPPAFAEPQLKDDFNPTINAFIEPIVSAPPQPEPTNPKVPPPSPKPTCTTNDSASSDALFVALAAGFAIGLAVACAFSKTTSVCNAAV
jgi:hypothetical protein